MQTFMPYPDFKQSAVALDNKRLGKQRVENLQILQRLLGYRLVTTETVKTGDQVIRYFDVDDNELFLETDPAWQVFRCTKDPIIEVSSLTPAKWHLEEIRGTGWDNHPAVKMWRGYEGGLLDYQEAICTEWTQGRGFKDTCLEKSKVLFYRVRGTQTHDTPFWIRWADVNQSHQSNLIRKDPEFYGPRFPGVPDDLPYVWPMD